MPVAMVNEEAEIMMPFGSGGVFITGLLLIGLTAIVAWIVAAAVQHVRRARQTR